MEQQDPVTWELSIDGDLARDLEQAIESRGWERDEGLRLLLACGMLYLEAERIVLRLRDGTLGAHDLAALSTRCSEMESHLARLRFRSFELQKALESWELSSGAVEATWRALPRESRRREREIAALRAEVEGLRARLEAQKPPATISSREQPDPS